PTTSISTLSLHDALPIFDVHHDGTGDGRVAENLPEGGAFAPADHQGALGSSLGGQKAWVHQCLVVDEFVTLARLDAAVEDKDLRSEEHTSELQSRGHLVC